MLRTLFAVALALLTGAAFAQEKKTEVLWLGQAAITRAISAMARPIQNSGLRRSSRQASAEALRGFCVSIVCGWPGASGSPCGPRVAVCSSEAATVSKSLIARFPSQAPQRQSAYS